MAPVRPILTQERIMELCHQILGMTSSDTEVHIEHTARSLTRVANGHVLSSNDGDVLTIEVRTILGGRGGYFEMRTDQIDFDVLRTMIQRCEAAAIVKEELMQPFIFNEPPTQDVFVPVSLWHDSTIEAMHASRATLLPDLMEPIAKAGMKAAGYVGFVARARAVMDKINKLQGYYEETDCEVSVTARTPDNVSSGWGGQADRRWEAIDRAAVTARAIDLAQRGINPQAVEPGRRTVILTRDAVAQLFRYFANFFDAQETEGLFAGRFMDGTPFTKRGVYPANRIGDRVFDERITMQSAPDDPEGGYAPYFWIGYGNPRITWVDKGVLKNLAWFIGEATIRHKPYSEDPWSLRVSGGPTTIEQMIAQCKEGVYVNQFHNVDLVEQMTGLMTGTTADGCFFVKDGKIDRPIKNYQFLDSPIFMLNNLVALGESKRAAYGYTPPGVVSGKNITDERREWWPNSPDWPRRPIIVPPMMVRDFNFISLADAV